MKPPDFYLTTAGEYVPLWKPRLCWNKARVKGESRNDYMLIEIDPPFSDERYGDGAEGVNHLLLSTKHAGHTLYPITEWPSHVYVTRILEPEVLSSLSFKKNQVKLIAWGLLYPTIQEAKAVANKT